MDDGDQKMDDGPVAKRQRLAPKRKWAAKRTRKPVYKLSLKNQLTEHKYKRSFQLDLWAVGQAKGYNFTISGLPNALEFGALYDQFRMDWVTIWAYPSQNSAEAAAAAVYIPTLFSYVDKDDATAPASLDEVLERGNKMSHYMDKGQKVASFRPHVDVEVYKSALTTGYASKAGLWIDNFDIPHFGWKAWLEPPLTGNNSIRLVADVYFTCKNSR